MTNEEAIKLFESGSDFPFFPHTIDMVDEACRMACEALRKSTTLDRTKWDGCIHCTTKRSLQARLNLGYDYCEHCGRPLTEHAWKRLENRIRGENNC